MTAWPAPVHRMTREIRTLLPQAEGCSPGKVHGWPGGREQDGDRGRGQRVADGLSKWRAEWPRFRTGWWSKKSGEPATRCVEDPQTESLCIPRLWGIGERFHLRSCSRIRRRSPQRSSSHRQPVRVPSSRLTRCAGFSGSSTESGQLSLGVARKPRY